MKRIVLIYFITLLLGFFLSACTSSNKNSENDGIIKKKRREVNMDKRTEEAKNSLFGALGGGKGTTYSFATSNILWRASLSSLDFMPLNTVDYAGGVIISDWYSSSQSNESIKIEVRFVSNELRSSSVNIKSFKKTCINTNCKTENMNKNFNDQIKNKIILKARELRIQDEKTKEKK